MFSWRADFTVCFNKADSSCQPKNSSIMPEARTEPKGLAMPFPAMLGAEPWTGSKSEVLAGVDVGGGGEAEAAGELGGEVADDVAEEIVGDDDVELAGVADEFHGEGVDIKVAGVDVGIFGADGFEDALPEVAGEGHGVGLVGHAEAEGLWWEPG